MGVPKMEGEKIYHYTSESGLLGIMKKGNISLQLTKIDSVNDTSEGKEIYGFVKEVCKEMLDKQEMKEEQYKEILKITDDAIMDCFTYKTDSGGYGIEMKKCEAFIMCFCEESDSLPMWNYYAHSGRQGYCLHFNLKYFEGKTLQFGKEQIVIYPERVIYLNEEKRNLIYEIITDGITKEDYLPRIKSGISYLRYKLKNESFKHENEVRIIALIPKDEVDKGNLIKFKTRNGYIIPYVETVLEFEDKDNINYNYNNKFLISGITIGPLANQEIAQQGLATYLEQTGYWIAKKDISISNIPIRF